MHSKAIHPAVRVGHVHLHVADLDRALGFYRDALGFGVTADAREHGLDMVLLAAGDYHHHIGLNTWDSAGATPPSPGHTGLYHVAFLYPDRRELVAAVGRLHDLEYPIDHATDHGGTVSVYLSDPDGNGVELYYDRPRATGSTATAGRSSRPSASTTTTCCPPRQPQEPEPACTHSSSRAAPPPTGAPTWTASSPTSWSPPCGPSPASPAP